MDQFDEDESDNDNDKLDKLEEQIKQQQEIINAIKQDNANLADQIDNIMNEKRIIEKEKHHERKKFEDSMKKTNKLTNDKDKNVVTLGGDSEEISKDDFDSIDDDSPMGTHKVPVMNERMTFLQTDNPNVDTGRKEYEEKKENKWKLEKAMKEAILDKLSKIIDDKIKNIKKDENIEIIEEENDPGRPHVNRVLVYFIPRSEEYNNEGEIIEEQASRKNTYIHYFRISKNTTFKTLKSAACEFWDEDENNYDLYYEDKPITKQGNVNIYDSIEKRCEKDKKDDAILMLKASNEIYQDNDSDGNENKNNAKEAERDPDSPEELFLNKFPGIRPLYTRKIKQDNKIGFVDETMYVGARSCATFTVYSLFLLFTCLLLFMRTNTVENYYSVSLVNNLFQQTFEETSSLAEVYQFLESIGDELLAVTNGTCTSGCNLQNVSDFNESSIPQIRTLTVLVGSIRLLSQRTKENGQFNLRNTNSSISKYHSEYDDDTKYTGEIDSSLTDCTNGTWSQYQSESSTKISRNIRGEFSSYDGSGYVHDFDPMNTRNCWKCDVVNLRNCHYLSESSRSLFIIFTLMNPSTGIWVAVEYLYEISVLGLVNPTRATVRPFKPNLLETGREIGLYVAEYLRLFLLIYIIGACIIVKIVQLQSLSKIFSINMLLQLGSDLALVIISIIIFAFVQVLSDKSTQELLDTDYNVEYIYYVTKGNIYSQIFILEALLFVLTMLKLIYVLSIVRTIRIISLSFELAMRQLISYGIVFMPILICFAVIGMGIWGPFSSQYRNFAQAFISVLFFTLGQTDMFTLMTVYEAWSIIYMAIFFLVLIYMIISIFVAIYADNYRLTILAEGYPDESVSYKGDKWDKARLKLRYKRTMVWVLGWLPTNWLKKLGLKGNFEDNDDQENSDEGEGDNDSD